MLTHKPSEIYYRPEEFLPLLYRVYGEFNFSPPNTRPNLNEADEFTEKHDVTENPCPSRCVRLGVLNDLEADDSHCSCHYHNRWVGGLTGVCWSVISGGGDQEALSLSLSVVSTV